MFTERAINGIDISHYQGNIRWMAMAQSSDVKFVCIKATEGSTNQDPIFKQNWDGALNKRNNARRVPLFYQYQPRTQTDGKFHRHRA